MTPCDDI